MYLYLKVYSRYPEREPGPGHMTQSQGMMMMNTMAGHTNNKGKLSSNNNCETGS